MEKSSDCKFNTSTFLSLDNLLESRKNSVNSTPRISPEMSPPKEDEDHDDHEKEKEDEDDEFVPCFG